MGKRFSDEELHALRNHIPMRSLIQDLLEVPCKEVEGVLRFLCPKCGGFETGINPKTNLSRCFRCQENFNAIELVMSDRKLSFVDSVKYLKRLFGKALDLRAPIPPGRIHPETSSVNIS